MTDISLDHKKIYYLLEEQGINWGDFGSDRLEAFDHGNDFCVVAYIHASNKLVLFRAGDYQPERRALTEMRDHFQDDCSGLLPPDLQLSALELTEDKLFKTASGFFYDAH